MKSFATISGLVKTTLVAVVAISALSGCGDNPMSSVNLNDDGNLNPNSELTDAVQAASGKAMFNAIESKAMQSLSLSEIVRLTPFIAGDKSIETATLSEIVAVTPAVVKFQDAFNAEMAALSVGEVIKVTRYMNKTGKNTYPFPELGGGSIS